MAQLPVDLRTLADITHPPRRPRPAALRACCSSRRPPRSASRRSPPSAPPLLDRRPATRERHGVGGARRTARTSLPVHSRRQPPLARPGARPARISSRSSPARARPLPDPHPGRSWCRPTRRARRSGSPGATASQRIWLDPASGQAASRSSGPGKNPAARDVHARRRRTAAARRTPARRPSTAARRHGGLPRPQLNTRARPGAAEADCPARRGNPRLPLTLRRTAW